MNMGPDEYEYYVSVNCVSNQMVVCLMVWIERVLSVENELSREICQSNFHGRQISPYMK